MKATARWIFQLDYIDRSDSVPNRTIYFERQVITMNFKKIAVLVAILAAMAVSAVGTGWCQEKYTAKTIYISPGKDSLGYDQRPIPYLLVTNQKNEVIKKSYLSYNDGYYLRGNILVLFREIRLIPYTKQKYVSASIYRINKGQLDLMMEIEKSNKAYDIASCMAYPLYEKKSISKVIGEDILHQSSLDE
jgi:hypothetical protein